MTLIGSRLGLVGFQNPSAKLDSIERLDRTFSAIHHIDEPEAARSTRGTVSDDVDRFDLSMATKEISKLVLRGVERKVPDVDLQSRLLKKLPKESMVQRCPGLGPRSTDVVTEGTEQSGLARSRRVEESRRASGNQPGRPSATYQLEDSSTVS